MILILIVVDNGLVRACFRSNNVLLCLVIILVSMEDGLVLNEFLKDLWHPNTEEPDKSKSDIITLGFYDDAYIQFKESIIWNKELWRHSISRNHIIKWAYLSDILPKQKGDNHD